MFLLHIKGVIHFRTTGIEVGVPLPNKLGNYNRVKWKLLLGTEVLEGVCIFVGLFLDEVSNLLGCSQKPDIINDSFL